MRQDAQPKDKVGILKVAASVMAAMFGVRAGKYHQRDVAQGRPAVYVVVGIVFTVLFVLILSGVVMLVTRLAGA
ncbi:MAG: DUF2970 domain-containing protein [Gammaproteobacteria bacterium]|nr:DUF2970 domain-containing protein [Gammaproteobacteria bacterium]NIR97604.1 DUF2970 domain-containing protein [Gammaproteobacteria bacterium]NIT63254.1 DUF2970 domain-containing protein [Gammaproteobacteria bacterium]NIV20186.1 DUF2970 domain-containing protein [Gammaproteobacteria bacterium]NIY31834.1 DUF2970 domain-containing protein [Gammaproteobacteria bacterium]